LPYTAEAFDTLFAAGGRDDLIDPKRTKKDIAADATLLDGELKKVTRTQTSAHWLDFCKRHGIPVGRVTSLEEMVARLPTTEHPIAGSYRAIPSPARFSKTPAVIRRPAPALGQDGIHVLSEAGYGAAEIGELVNGGILALPTDGDGREKPAAQILVAPGA
jgi:crotonobetainyl-CoA:carnitine CoA-transferase CaiB-like acyl-CoA transferase